ncbi:MAG: FtsQ-type POTRA domain-containing protein [Kiritimatiellae bacterium]|nr:FtsQ-type POTRA domain-containing protein [Kiritimatiellia bacterium]
MKSGRENRRGPSDRGSAWRKIGAALVFAVFAALAAAAVFVFGRCRDMWISQCRVTDARRQISIEATPHIGEDLLLELFGLTNGCNLALMDFEALRGEILREQPMIKELSITRKLPGRLEIKAVERKPVARVGYSERTITDRSGRIAKRPYWLLTDSEGVVFRFSLAETKLLPRIVGAGGRRAGARPPLKPGERLSGREMAGLRLVCESRNMDPPVLQLLDVDISDPTYLTAATAGYDTIKIDWQLVHDPESPSQPGIRNALDEIRSIMSNRLAGPLRSVFTVSENGRVNMLASGAEGSR